MVGTGLRHSLIRVTRHALRRGAQRSRTVRRLLGVSAREFERALRDDHYESAYYGGAASQPSDQIGTATFTRDTTHGNEAAYLAWRWFPGKRVLDIGCAFGFSVEAMRDLGLDASGVDVSKFALEHAAAGARGHVTYGNLLHRLPYGDKEFDIVCAFETLEHLPPTAVPKALLEIRRCTNAYALATIPSFGPNRGGPGGWFDVKVRPERLDHYRSRGDEYQGPVAYDDLYRDERGEPIEGHLTIASFEWWTARFADAGFVRCYDVERRIHPHLARFGLTKYWNLYALRLADVPEPDDDVRGAGEIGDVERQWGLTQRVADPEDVKLVIDALGADAFGDLDA